jgi:hypothetical protein
MTTHEENADVLRLFSILMETDTVVTAKIAWRLVEGSGAAWPEFTRDNGIHKEYQLKTIVRWLGYC